MRLTTIGHATLDVETASGRLLVDPWLGGSCYWRSWWHYPPIPTVDPAWEHPDFVYLSHHHFDHFHYPTLRRIDRAATVFVPRFAVDVMAPEVRALGFRDVVELDHGATERLPGGVELTSYQYGFDDSALIIDDGGCVVADLNDCKVRGPALGELRRRHGRPALALKSYSWAQAYPRCYTAEDPADLTLLSPGLYVADFVDTMRELRPRYAIPFASAVCFLHPQSRPANDGVVSIDEVRKGFEAAAIDGSELVAMGPADSWDEEEGFALADWSRFVDEREEHLERLAREAAPAVEAQTAAEAARPLSYSVFEAYFARFLRALPPATARVLPRPITFHVASSVMPYWTLDPRDRSVRRGVEVPADSASVITVDDGLLADAIDKRIVNFLHISMRVRVALAADGVATDLMFWALLTIWELGYLPAGAHLRPRAVDVAWRRRRELWGAGLSKVVGRGRFVDRMAANLMARDPIEPG